MKHGEYAVKAALEGKFLCYMKAAVPRVVKRVIREKRIAIDRKVGILYRSKFFSRCKVHMKKVVFMTFQGEYTCNPKYITEQLLQQNSSLDIVWIVRKGVLNAPFVYDIPEGVRLVEQYTYEYYRELASARVWVSNSIDYFRRDLPKKNNQIMIETWHGSLGIKRFDKDSYKSSVTWVEAAEKCGENTDYCISNSSFETQIYKDTYWNKSKILEFGHPRNDVLINSKDVTRLREKIFNYIKREDNGEKIVLYAPTFRDDHKISYYMIEAERVCSALQNRFGGDWLFLVRYHPTIKKEISKVVKGDRSKIDVTKYPDIQELMCVVDVGITDYSSWIYDYVLTQRPCFLYCTDYEMYKEERGFAYPLKETPFSISQNNNQLCENIMNFTETDYERKVDDFLKDKGCIEDGNASKRVADFIVRLTTKR